MPESVNLLGTIAGFYYDTNSAGHGFLRLPSDENQLLPETNSAIKGPATSASPMVSANRGDPRRSAVSPMLRPHQGLITPSDRRVGSGTYRISFYDPYLRHQTRAL